MSREMNKLVRALDALGHDTSDLEQTTTRKAQPLPVSESTARALALATELDESA